MKRIPLYAAMATALLLTACSKANKIETITSNISVSVKGQSDTIVVCADASWDITAPEWTQIDKREKSFIVTVPANTTKALLEGEIVITGAEGVSKSIAISQNYKATYLELSENNAEFTYNGGEKVFELKTDGAEPKITATDGIKATLGGEKLTLVAPANSKPATVSSVVKIEIDGLSQQIDVTVAGKVCEKCNGRGVIKCPDCDDIGYTKKTCSECGGEGYAYCCQYTGRQFCRRDHANNRYEIVCPVCKGEK